MNLHLLMNAQARQKAILQALSDRPLHGVALGKKIDVDIIFLYPSLVALERTKLITSWQDEQRLEGRGYERRTFYGLTELGRASPR